MVKLKQVKLDKEFATANKRKKQLTKKEALRNQKEADDFWNTPVNTDTQQDQTDRKVVNKKLKRYASKKHKIASTKKAVLRKKEEIEQYWAAKRNKLKNTPKPGEKSGTFVDERDGHEYKWVKIGEQVWMAENLQFPSGVHISSNKAWENLDINDKAYCWVNDEYNSKYGCLYTYETAKNVCPIVWHLPSIDEWKKLSDYIDKFDKNGNISKSIKGFLGGERDQVHGNGYYNGSFKYIGEFGTYWSSTIFKRDRRKVLTTYWSNNDKDIIVDPGGYANAGDYKSNGHSVRCIKD